MSEIRIIFDQLDDVYDAEPWYGPSVTAVLDGFPARRIHERPVSGAHSAAELIAHMAFWKEVVVRRLDGDAVRDANRLDWPELEQHRMTLRSLRKRLDVAHGALLDRVREMDDAGLDARVPGQRIKVRQMLYGVIQHDVYHCGQLALLRRALEDGS